MGYVILPNGSRLNAVAGVIDTVWTGLAGAVTLITPNYTDPIADKQKVIQLSTNPAGTSGDYVGAARFKGVGKFYAIGCTKITSVTADKAWFVNIAGSGATFANLMKAETVATANCNSLTSLAAPFWNAIEAPNCALTAKSIGDLLLAAVQNNPTAEYLNCLGGTNASDTAIDDYLITKGTDLATVLAALPNLSASFNT